MKNKDIEQLSREQLAQKFNEALKTEDTEQVAPGRQKAGRVEEEVCSVQKTWQQLSSWTHRQAARGLRS